MGTERRNDRLFERKRTRREFLGDMAKIGIGAATGINAASMLSGCGPAPSPAAPTPTTAPAVVPTKTPSTELPTIVWAFDQDIDNLDAQDFVSDAAYMHMANVYHRPTDYAWVAGDKGEILQDDMKFVPYGCESYEVADNLQSVTFNLRKDAKFSNGAPVTAEDWKYTFDRAVGRAGSLKGPMDMMALTSPDQIVKLDDHTLQIKPNKRYVVLMEVITRVDMGILNKDWSEEHATADDPWASTWYRTHSLGAGPYLLESWEPGVQFVLRPNPNFWDPTSLKNAGHIVKFVPSGPDRLAVLKRGDVDVAMGIPPKDLPELEQDPSIIVHAVPTIGYNFLGMNNKIPPFDNKLVRQAFSYAVPYDTLIEKAYYGYADRLYGPVPTLMPYFDQSQWDQYGYETNVEKAKELLAQAGYPNGEGFPPQEIAVLATKENWVEVAVWIQSALSELGINVTVNKMADAPFFEKLNAKELPLFIHYFRAWVNHPAYHSYYMLHSESPINWYNYSNPEVDSLLEAGMYELDPAKQEEYFKKAHALTIQDAPCVWLFSYQHVICTRANVSGLALYTDLMFRLHHLTKA